MDRSGAVCIDMGTTNCRVWLTSGARIVAKATAPVGAGESARAGNRDAVRTTVGRLVARVRQEGMARGFAASYVAGCGMITSPLGLTDVPHVPAPAGIDELARRLERHEFPGITDLPVLLVPGVRCGPHPVETTGVETSDLVRGEETFCVGLLEGGRTEGPCTVVTLGSHWKAIELDGRGRLVRSRTTLTGELVHAVRTATVLASGLPDGRPAKLEPAWVEAGMQAERASGLARALFCVRLLESCDSTPEDRLAFLHGAAISADLDTLVPPHPEEPFRVLVSGDPALTETWRRVLRRVSIAAEIVRPEDRETALLRGLRSIVDRSGLGPD